MVMYCYGHVAQPRKFYAGSVCCSAHIVYLNPQLAPLCDAPSQPELVLAVKQVNYVANLQRGNGNSTVLHMQCNISVAESRCSPALQQDRMQL